jgi:hypothetical protein
MAKVYATRKGDRIQVGSYGTASLLEERDAEGKVTVVATPAVIPDDVARALEAEWQGAPAFPGRAAGTNGPDDPGEPARAERPPRTDLRIEFDTPAPASPRPAPPAPKPPAEGGKKE